MLPEFLVRRCVLLCYYLVVLKRYGEFYRHEKLIFLYQCFDFKDSKPSSLSIFSVEDSLMAPVTPSAALYSSHSSLAWKVSLNVLSYIKGAPMQI